MAGRGTSASFLDRLQGLADEIAQVAAAPDAGPGGREFAMALLDQVQERMSVQTQMVDQAGNDLGAPPSAQPAYDTAPPADPYAAAAGGMGGPMPMTEAPTRLPSMSPDMTGATAELERALAG